MKKPCSPYRTMTTPFASVPYTIGFYDFLKDDRAIAAKAPMSKHSLEYRKSSGGLASETKHTRTSLKSPKTNKSTEFHMDQDHLKEMIRRIAQEEIAVSKKKYCDLSMELPRHGRTASREINQLRNEIQSVACSLESDRVNRQKAFQSMWNSLSSKFHQEIQCKMTDWEQTQENDHVSKVATEPTLASLCRTITEIQQKVNGLEKSQDEQANKCRHQYQTMLQQKNHQLDVVITSIEHLNVRLDQVSRQNIQKTVQIQSNVSNLQKQLMTAKSFRASETATQETRRELLTLRQSFRTELSSLKSGDFEEIKKQIQRWQQHNQTDFLNMKARIKKIECNLKQLTSDSEVKNGFEDGLVDKLANFTGIYDSNFEKLDGTLNELTQLTSNLITMLSSLTKKMVEWQNNTDSTLKTSLCEITSMKNQLYEQNEAKLEASILAIRESLNQFQSESKRLVESRPPRTAKQESDLTGSISCQSLLSSVKLKELPQENTSTL